MLAAHEPHDRLVHSVAGAAQRARLHDATQRHHCNIGGAAADIDHHRAGRLINGKASAYRGRNRFFDQENFARASRQRRFVNRAPFDGRGTGGHADQDARPHHFDDRLGAANELPQHFLGRDEVGDNAVAQGPDRFDAFGRAADHELSFLANGQNIAHTTLGADGDNRWFIEHDTAAGHMDQRICSTKINGDIVRKNAINAETQLHVERGPLCVAMHRDLA